MGMSEMKVKAQYYNVSHFMIVAKKCRHKQVLLGCMCGKAGVLYEKSLEVVLGADNWLYFGSVAFPGLFPSSFRTPLLKILSNNSNII